MYPSKRVIEIDGKKFFHKRTKYKKIDNIEHVDYEIWEELDEKELKEKLDYVVNKVKKNIPPKLLTKEVLKNLPLQELNRLYKILKEKDSEVKTHEGCLGVLIRDKNNKRNRAYIQIVE